MTPFEKGSILYVNQTKGNSNIIWLCDTDNGIAIPVDFNDLKEAVEDIEQEIGLDE